MLAFTDSGIPLTGATFGDNAWGDYDADGDLDVFITGFGSSDLVAELWRNNNDGTFSNVSAGQFPDGVVYSSVDWGDYDNDGDLDLIYSGATDSGRVTQLYRNDGSDTFTLVNAGLIAAEQSTVKFVDFDTDGDLDIFVAGATGSVSPAIFYRNDGTDSFTNAGALGVTAFSKGSVDFADYDHDGDLDLLASGTNNGGATGSFTRIYRNEGGTFADISAGMIGTYRGEARWADLDGDGDLDVITTGRTNLSYATRFLVYENNAGSFAEAVNTNIGDYDARLAVGDYDNDGDLDILVSYDFPSETRLLENQGNFGFDVIDSTLDGLLDFGGASVDFVDFDNDGDLDALLTGNDGSSQVSVLYENDVADGLAETPNEAPAAPTGLVASQNQGVVTLTWTAPTDDITPGASLRYMIRVGTTPGGIDVVAPQALVGTNDGFRKTLSLGLYGSGGARLQSLIDGQTYYWSVQAIDHGYVGSPFAAEGSFVYDGVAPTLVSFTRQSPTSENTSANVLVFRATFSEAVTNVDATDFLVSGGSTATVTNVSSADGGVGLLWDITVSGGDLDSYEGMVGLDLAAGQNITDLVQYPVPAGEPTTDETYTRANVAVPPIVVSGAATGEDTIRVFHAVTGELLGTISPFPGFTGGVRVALADLNGDDVAEIIAAAGPGGGPHVRIFDGETLAQIDGPLGSFFAYDAAFTGGVYVAAGDIDHDGHIDIITGAGAGGGPHVKVFSGDDRSELMSFFAYEAAFTGGVSVAAGDVNNDFHADIITGAGPGGGPHVRVFSGDGGSELMSFFAYDAAFTGGVFVASGDVNNDFHADIITGAGAGGGPHVKVFSGLDQSVLASFMAYDADDAATPEVEPTFTGGVYVASLDINGDDRDDIVTGAGPGGGPHVRVFDAITLDDLTVDAGYYTVDADYRFGASVAGEVRARVPAST
jgi:hypothetical protein